MTTQASLEHLTKAGTLLFARCHVRVLPQAHMLLKYLDAQERKIGKLQAGARLGLGWSVVSLRAGPTGLHCEEPDFGSNPLANTRDDVSVSVVVMAGQQEVRRLAGNPPALDTPFYSTLIVGGDALAHERIYLERLEPTSPMDSGWYVGPRDDDIKSKTYDAMPTYKLLQQRRELLQVLALPLGWVASFSGSILEEIIDPSDRIVFKK